MRRFALGAILLGTAGAAPADGLFDLVAAARSAPPSCAGAAAPAPGPSLIRKTLLDLAAAEQAAFVAASGRVTHDGPDGRRPKDRVASLGVAAADVAEIVYLGRTGGPERALAWWRRDALHCRLLADPRWTLAGAAAVRGRAGTAYVVVFAAR